ncbi:MAG: hypothetical protein IIA67_12720, partial [Planctomycetes bacterium]|nr:hypothetical protein [Planctomycetota bacterium]
MNRIAYRVTAWLALFGAVLLATSDTVSLAVDNGSTSTARKLLASEGVLVIAHRGDSKVAPENTLPAFASAVQAGADLVELDYFHSSDGVPVVFHDDELDRTTI